MFAQRCTISTSLPRPWVWAALTDAQNLPTWSGIEGCTPESSVPLDVGNELHCTLTLLGREVGATLAVVDVDAERCLVLRIESLVATLFESVTLTQEGSTTVVEYELDAMSPVAGPAFRTWIRAHAQVAEQGLRSLLTDDGSQRLRA